VPLTDGLNFYRTLAAQAVSWLKPEGKIMLEFGDGQDGAIKKSWKLRTGLSKR